METYTLLRAFADSWMLLALFSIFTGIAVWAFWPGEAAAREEARLIPFRHDDTPGRGADERAEP